MMLQKCFEIQIKRGKKCEKTSGTLKESVLQYS
jgi:hypothetical protein